MENSELLKRVAALEAKLLRLQKEWLGWKRKKPR